MRVSNAHGAPLQTAWANVSSEFEISVGQSYGSEGTAYGSSFATLYAQNNGRRSTLSAFVDDFEWRKCGGGSLASDCVAATTKTQSTSTLRKMSDVRAVLRTQKAWVDRRDIFFVYAAFDEDGSPVVEVPSVTLNDQQSAFASSSCSTSTLGTPTTQFLDSCVASVAHYSFPAPGTSSSYKAVGMTFGNTASGSDLVIEMGSVELVAPPFWYHSYLRTSWTGTNSWPITPVVATDTLVTGPSYPVYALETFDVHAYNARHMQFGPVDFFEFRIAFDASVVEYASDYQINSAFTGASLDTSVPGALTVLCTGGGTAASLNGFFWLFRVSFRTLAGTPAGTLDSTIRVQKKSLNNLGSAPLGVMEHSTCLDHRPFMGEAENASVALVVREPLRVNMIALPDATYATSQEMGRIFNYRVIDGLAVDNWYVGVSITDDDRGGALAAGTSYQIASLLTCAHELGSSYITVVESGKCRFALSHESVSGAAQFSISDDVHQAFARFRIVSPESVSVVLDDPTLNRIASVTDPTGCSPLEYQYQRTRVRVLADGYDVTALATRLYVESVTVADLLAASSRDIELTRVVAGKAEGSTTVRLYDFSNVAAMLAVSNQIVTPSELRARVITDVSWLEEPPAQLDFPQTFTASVVARQSFTQRPIGSVRASYGYLFASIVWSDGKQETVLPGEMSVSGSHAGIQVTPPGGVDTSSGVDELTLHNDAPGADRFMLSVTAGAQSECVEGDLSVAFVKCGVVVSQTSPVVFLDIPKPIGILANISVGFVDGRRMTPTHGAASLAPFAGSETAVESALLLTVLYGDGSSVSGYEAQDGVAFYAEDAACGIVNGTVLTVPEGSQCDEVVVRVNVTLGDRFFHGRDDVGVVRLRSVTTTAAPYPLASPVPEHSLLPLHPLPCTSAVVGGAAAGSGAHPNFETASLSSVATLTDGTRKDVTAHMTYASTATAVRVDGSRVTARASLSETTSAAIGATVAELMSGEMYADGDSVEMINVTISVVAQHPSRNYASTWTGVPSTLSIVQGQTLATSVTLSYHNLVGGLSYQFAYPDVTAGGYWFVPDSNMLAFTSEQPAYINVTETGALVAMENHYQQVTLRMSVCLGSQAEERDVWVNLLPAPGDVDAGTTLATTLSPFYFPDASSVFTVHLWARPASGKYLRGVQISGRLPPGLSTAGSPTSAWTPSAGSSYVSTGSWNVVDAQTFGVTAFAPSGQGSSARVHLGHFTFTSPQATGVLGQLTIDVLQIQSDTHVACASSACRTTDGPFTAAAGTAFVFVGATRRVLSVDGTMRFMSHITPPVRRRRADEGRLLSEPCDPCTERVYGDADGDCKLRLSDVTAVNDMVSTRGAFTSQGSTGAILEDPLYDLLAANGGDAQCNFTLEQFNPQLNLMGPTEGVVSVSDPRYGAPHITVADAVHLQAATQSKKRFLFPSATCMPSSDEFGDRPDVVVRAEVYAVDQIASTTHLSESEGARDRSVRTRVLLLPFTSLPAHLPARPSGAAHAATPREHCVVANRCGGRVFRDCHHERPPWIDGELRLVHRSCSLQRHQRHRHLSQGGHADHGISTVRVGHQSTGSRSRQGRLRSEHALFRGEAASRKLPG